MFNPVIHARASFLYLQARMSILTLLASNVHVSWLCIISKMLVSSIADMCKYNCRSDWEMRFVMVTKVTIFLSHTDSCINKLCGDGERCVLKSNTTHCICKDFKQVSMYIVLRFFLDIEVIASRAVPSHPVNS